MEASGKEKADTLLQIIGVGDRLLNLEETEKEKYNERLAIGRIADQKEKFAKEQEYFPDAPDEPVSAADLIKQQQEILARNGENQKKRERVDQIGVELTATHAQVMDLKQRLNELEGKERKLAEDLDIAQKSAANLEDESTEELERNIANVDEINRKVRANLDKIKAEDDAKQYRERYNKLTGEIEETRKAKTDLLNGAELPLPELSVADGELTYKGQKWDNMSGSDRLKVSTAIVRKLNPKCGFVLLDKLEQMDLVNLKEFGAWLEAEGLQAIATRVSTGDECSIIITDGYSYDKDGKLTVAEEEAPKEEPKKQKKWTKGAF
jgi:hypothetical protein